MGFFATFWTWLNGQLATYIGDYTARMATALEPALITCATLYVMAWGYLHLMGQVEEPFVTGVKRVLTLGLILGAALHLWLYNSVMVDTFYTAPAQLAAAVIGASDPVGMIDNIWDLGGRVAGKLWTKGAVYSVSGIGFYIGGTVVWLFVGLLCVYSMFLIALASIALSVLLALGPLFIGLLLFETSKRFFEAWIAQLATYALITILTVLIGALLLQIVGSYARQTEALGSALLTVDALNMVLASALVFLVMRQVMPLAAGLAGGIALNTFGVVSRSVHAGLGLGKPSAVLAAKGLKKGAPHAWAAITDRQGIGRRALRRGIQSVKRGLRMRQPKLELVREPGE